MAHFHHQLSPTLRRTFQLHDVEGLSLCDTARILGIPTGTVKARSARARQKMKELLGHALRRRSRGLTDKYPIAKDRQRRAAALDELTVSVPTIPQEDVFHCPVLTLFSPWICVVSAVLKLQRVGNMSPDYSLVPF